MGLNEVSWDFRSVTGMLVEFNGCKMFSLDKKWDLDGL